MTFQLLKKHWTSMEKTGQHQSVEFSSFLLSKNTGAKGSQILCENFKHRRWHSSSKKGGLVWTRGTKCLDRGSQHETVTLVSDCLHHNLYSHQKTWIAIRKLDCNHRNHVPVIVHPIWHDWSMLGLSSPRVSLRSHKCKIVQTCPFDELQRFSPRNHALGPGMCDCCMSSIGAKYGNLEHVTQCSWSLHCGHSKFLWENVFVCRVFQFFCFLTLDLNKHIGNIAVALALTMVPCMPSRRFWATSSTYLGIQYIWLYYIDIYIIYIIYICLNNVFRAQAFSVALLCPPLNTFFEDTFPGRQFGKGSVWRHILTPHRLTPHFGPPPHLCLTPHFDAALFDATFRTATTFVPDATLFDATFRSFSEAPPNLCLTPHFDATLFEATFPSFRRRHHICAWSHILAPQCFDATFSLDATFGPTFGDKQFFSTRFWHLKWHLLPGAVWSACFGLL